MTSRRLPDFKPNITDDYNVFTADLSYYIADLVRTLQMSINDLEQGLDDGNRIITHSTNTLSTSGNLPLGVGVILCDASASALTITLPDPYEQTGRAFHIKKINTNSNDVTLNVQTSATIDKSTTKTLTGAQRPSVTVYSDGSEYWII